MKYRLIVIICVVLFSLINNNAYDSKKPIKNFVYMLFFFFLQKIFE
jgi:hypothetical protein